MKRYILLIACLVLLVTALTLGNIPQPEKVKVVPYPVIIEKDVIWIKEVPVETIKEIETTVFRYPTSLPYERFVESLTYEQAKVLLEGMRQSHLAALYFQPVTEFEKWLVDPDFQRQAIEWYDQLLDYIRRH